MDSRLINRFESRLDYSLQAAKVTGTAYSDWRRKPWKGSYTLNYSWKMDSIGSEKSLTTYDGTRIESYQKRPTRTFSLSVNYTFRSGKAFMKKKIEQSGSEEKRRL